MAQKSTGWRTNAVSARCSRSVRNSIPDRIVTLPAKFAYLLFTGSRVVLVRALSADDGDLPADGGISRSPRGHRLRLEDFAVPHLLRRPVAPRSPRTRQPRLGLDGERTDLWGLVRIVPKRAEISRVPRTSCLVPRHGGGRWLPRNPAKRLAISIINPKNSASQPTYTVIAR